MPLDPKQTKLTARLAALDYLVTHLLNANYANASLTEEQIAALEQVGLARLGRTTFLGADAVVGDVLADEIRAAVESLLRQAAQLRADHRTE